MKKLLALALAIMMVMSSMVMVSAAEETVAAVDYTVAANSLASLGIVKGTSDDIVDFNAEANVKRYEMALLMVRIMTGEVDDLYWNKVADNTTPFADVDEYYGAIAYVADNGIVKGVGDNKFNPDGQIILQDALTMAVRALGYKQLDYPQGFVNTAKALGLTEGLAADLANDKALNRGETFQIIYNTLFATAKNGKTFAALNFGMTQDVYVVAATNLQSVDYDKLAPVAKAGYIALAKLNADGSYDLNDIIHVTVDELNLGKDESVEQKLGYSFTVTSFDSIPGQYAIKANDTKKLVSYGDNAAPVITAGTAYNNITASKYVKIDGVNYELVTEYTNLYNKNTSKGNNDAELIVYSMFEDNSETTINFSNFIYDAAGNILNPYDEDGDLLSYDQMKVALYLRRGLLSAEATYYVKLSDESVSIENAVYRPATEADFAEYAVTVSYENDSPLFGVVTAQNDLLKNGLFYEITLIDDNNDGTYDRAFYIPYSVGKYTTKTDANVVHWDVKTSKTESASKTASPQINGIDLDAWVFNTSGARHHVVPAVNSTYIKETDITFVGNKPAKNDYIVYYYNSYSRELTVVENLGAAKTAAVTNYTTGTYTYYKDVAGYQGYYYAGAQAYLDGTAVNLGYRPGETYSQFTTADTALVQINESLAKYGFDTKITAAAMNPTYARVNYVVLAGRVIYLANAGTLTDGNNWMAFDYGYSTKSTNGIYTTYDYKGDIVGVDENTGNIQVLAYLPANGNQTLVEIETINGYNYGLLVADYAALQYQYSGIGILQANAFETMKKIVIKDFFKTLTVDLNSTRTDADYNALDESTYYRQLFYIVTGKNAETGAYQIYTDVEEYWGTANVNTYRQPAEVSYTKQSTYAMFFNYGITAATVYNSNGKGASSAAVMQQNDNSVTLIIAQDGIYKYTGKIMDGKYINFPGRLTRDASGALVLDSNAGKAASVDNDDKSIYKLTNDYIVVLAPNYKVEEITNIEFDAVSTTGYNYYMVIGDANASNAYAKNTQFTISLENGVPVYYYTNLYCLNTASVVSTAVRVVGGLEGFTNVANQAIGYNAVKPIGAVYAEKAGEFTLLNGADLVDITPNQAGVLNTVKSANGLWEFLAELYINGVTVDGVTYAPIYSQAMYPSGSKAASTFQFRVKMKNGANDPTGSQVILNNNGSFEYKAQVLTFTNGGKVYNDDGTVKATGYIDSITVTGVKASNTDDLAKSYVVFCDYVENALFNGTALALKSSTNGKIEKVVVATAE